MKPADHASVPVEKMKAGGQKGPGHISFYLFAFFVCIYMLTNSDSSLYRSDAGIRYEVTRSIVERFDLDISPGQGVKGTDGRDYSWFGIGYSLLSVPFYIGGKFTSAPEVGVSVMNPIFAAATSAVMFLFLVRLRYSHRASLTVALFYGLGTLAWPMSKPHFDHAAECFFLLLSFYFMYVHITDGRKASLFLSSACMGVAVLTRPVAVLALPALFFMTVFYRRNETARRQWFKTIISRSLIFSASLLPFMLVILFYNYYRFGSAFETGYTLIAHRTGINFFAGTPIATGLTGLLVSPGKGFFYYSPVAVLFFFSIAAFCRKHLAVGLSLLLLVILYLLFLSGNIFWHGDWAWGPRYIFSITPALMIPAAELFDSPAWRSGKVTRSAICIVFAVSLTIQLAAVSVDYQRYFFHSFFVEKMKFTVTDGEGVQRIVEPSAEVYFDWKRSPLLAQFKSIYEIGQSIGAYKYVKPTAGTPAWKMIDSEPHMRSYDFWWLYKYCMDGSITGFLAAGILFSFSLYCAFRMQSALQSEAEEK